MSEQVKDTITDETYIRTFAFWFICGSRNHMFETNVTCYVCITGAIYIYTLRHLLMETNMTCLRVYRWSSLHLHFVIFVAGDKYDVFTSVSLEQSTFTPFDIVDADEYAVFTNVSLEQSTFTSSASC